MRKKEIALILFRSIVELEQRTDEPSLDETKVGLTELALTLAAEAGWDWERDHAYVQWCSTADQYQIAKENLKRFTAFCEL